MKTEREIIKVEIQIGKLIDSVHVRVDPTFGEGSPGSSLCNYEQLRGELAQQISLSIESVCATLKRSLLETVEDSIAQLRGSN